MEYPLNTETNQMNRTDKEIIRLALYIASLRSNCPSAARLLETALFSELQEKFPESTVRFVMELTETRLYH